MTKHSNHQDLLKFIALIAMSFDHLGLYFFPEINEFRVIGRYTMPIFCFFAGYNFKGSMNLSILFFGVILYVVTTIFIFSGYFIETNILIPIFLGQLYLYLFEKHFKDFNKGYLHFIFLALLWPITAHLLDYGTLGISFMVIGYMSRLKSMDLKLAAFVMSFISILHTTINFTQFNNFDLFLSFIVALATFISIALGGFERDIKFNIRIISRYSMFIYFFQLLIFQLVWRYYVMSQFILD